MSRDQSRRSGPSTRGKADQNARCRPSGYAGACKTRSVSPKVRPSGDPIVVALVLLRRVAVKLGLSPAAPAQVTTEDMTLAVQACVLGGGADLLTNL